MHAKPIPYIPQRQQDRFWDRVDRDGPNGCWIFTGNRSGNGYGLFYVAFGDERRLQVATHRLAYHLTYGEIPPGMVVRHTCDVRLCVRPDHLVLGSQKQNIHDTLHRGRFHHQQNAPSKTNPWRDDTPGRVSGERHGCARLTEAQVIEIRRRYSQGDVTLTILGEEFGTSRGNVQAIVRYHLWSHLEGPDLGRGCKVKGERHRSARLTADQVKEIRRLYETGRMNRADISRKFGVSFPAIDAIVKRITWKHVA